MNYALPLNTSKIIIQHLQHLRATSYSSKTVSEVRMLLQSSTMNTSLQVSRNTRAFVAQSVCNPCAHPRAIQAQNCAIHKLMSSIRVHSVHKIGWSHDTRSADIFFKYHHYFSSCKLACRVQSQSQFKHSCAMRGQNRRVSSQDKNKICA